MSRCALCGPKLSLLLRLLLAVGKNTICWFTVHALALSCQIAHTVGILGGFFFSFNVCTFTKLSMSRRNKFLLVFQHPLVFSKLKLMWPTSSPVKAKHICPSVVQTSIRIMCILSILHFATQTLPCNSVTEFRVVCAGPQLSFILCRRTAPSH